MENCIFCKIVKKELPSTTLHEDDEVLAFLDIHPVRPVHIIIIPKEHISELLAVENPIIFQKILTVAQKMVKEKGLEDKGYRITNNGGGAQLIDHLHFHVLGPITKTAAMS